MRRVLICFLILSFLFTVSVFAIGDYEESYLSIYRLSLVVSFVLFGVLLPLGGMITCGVMCRRPKAVKHRWIVLLILLSLYLAFSVAFFILNL